MIYYCTNAWLRARKRLTFKEVRQVVCYDKDFVNGRPCSPDTTQKLRWYKKGHKWNKAITEHSVITSNKYFRCYAVFLSVWLQLLSINEIPQQCLRARFKMALILDPFRTTDRILFKCILDPSRKWIHKERSAGQMWPVNVLCLDIREY